MDQKHPAGESVKSEVNPLLSLRFTPPVAEMQIGPRAEIQRLRKEGE